MIRLPSVLPYTHEGILFKLVQEDLILKDESAKYVTAIDDISQSTFSENMNYEMIKNYGIEVTQTSKVWSYAHIVVY